MKTEVELGGSFLAPQFNLCFANQDKMKCIDYALLSSIYILLPFT